GTPLAHALAYLRTKKLTGAFDLRAPDGRAAVLALYRGKIAGVRVAPIHSYLSEVIESLGFVEKVRLEVSLKRALANKRKHGEVLVESGELTDKQRDEALAEQM